jgi:hypothetical protein
MRRSLTALLAVLLIAPAVAGCQSPSNADDAINYDDLVDSTFNPNPLTADQSDGRTYRVVRGNNQPDDILAYDWKTAFSIAVSLNSNATDKKVDLAFPVKLTAASVVVKQASGGIVTPPSGTDTEHFESVSTQTSGNELANVGSPVNLSFDVWYDLPSLRKEALVTVSLTFLDDDGRSFSVTRDVRVSP